MNKSLVIAKLRQGSSFFTNESKKFPKRWLGVVLVLAMVSITSFFFLGFNNKPGKVTDDDSLPTYWPTNGWQYAQPSQVGLNGTLLEDMKNKIVTDQLGVDSVTVVKNGYLVVDEYYHQYQRGDLHNIFSCTKSIISALVGIAHDKGDYPSLDTKVLSLFPGRQVKNVDDWKRSLAIRDLLTLTSGFDLNEGLNVGSDYYAFLNSTDPVQFSLDLPMRSKPGTSFYYNSPAVHLATRILAERVKMTPLEYANKYLFGPLNITKTEWPTDPDGNNWGQTYLKLTPHDMAKIGYLYLNEGKWDGKQIISEEWVRESTSLHVNVTSSYGYGYFWWVAPGKYYYAMGAQGQYIIVVPSKDLVAVFTCSSFMSQGTPENLLKTYILPSIKR